jgi:hypothetical protein
MKISFWASEQQVAVNSKWLCWEGIWVRSFTANVFLKFNFAFAFLIGGDSKVLPRVVTICKNPHNLIMAYLAGYPILFSIG